MARQEGLLRAGSTKMIFVSAGLLALASVHLLGTLPSRSNKVERVLSTYTSDAAQGTTSRKQPTKPLPSIEASPPASLQIPSIGVDASVVKLGLDANGTLEAPPDFAAVGWWSGGSMPGQPGPVVLAGHVDSLRGPAVFYRLRELAPRDMFIVQLSNGRSLSYMVKDVIQVSRDDFPSELVYGMTEEQTMRLITCAGSFDRASGQYQDNLIVLAELVGVDTGI